MSGWACYVGDDVVRGRGQWLGLLHAGCAEKAKSATKEGP